MTTVTAAPNATLKVHPGVGTENEYATSYFLSVFMATVISTLLLTHAAVKRQEIIGEAGLTLLIGIVAGGVFRLFYTSKIEDKEMTYVTEEMLGFNSSMFFCVLLPPIIFASGYHMKSNFFLAYISQILTLALAGTLISTFVVGFLLYYLGVAGVSLAFSLPEALTFGALISATDPVSTLAVFEHLHVNPQLFYLVFGESVLNDAVAIVLFRTFAKFIGAVSGTDAVGVAILDFAVILVGSTLLGLGIGMVSALVFKNVHVHENHALEILLFLSFAYVPFLVAELCSLSGIVAILFAGIAMKQYTYNNLSHFSRTHSDFIVGIFEKLAETIVFLDLGTSIWSFGSKYRPDLVVWTFLVIVIARVLNVYPLAFVLNKFRCGKRRIKPRQQHMLCFAGLRGAIAYALSTQFPGENEVYVRSTTIVVVAITVFLFGCGTKPMIAKLKIKVLSDMQYAMVHTMAPDVHDHFLSRLDRNYLQAFLCRSMKDLPQSKRRLSRQWSPSRSSSIAGSSARAVASPGVPRTPPRGGAGVELQTLSEGKTHTPASAIAPVGATDITLDPVGNEDESSGSSLLADGDLSSSAPEGM